MNSAKDSLPSKSRSMFVKNSSTSALHGEQYLIYDEDSHDVIYLSDLQKIWTSLFWCLVIENVVHGYKYYLMHEPDYEGNLLFTQNEYQQARMFLNLVYIFRGQFFEVENGAEKLWTVLPNCSFFMLLMLFQTAAAITEIYFGKARVLVCIKNWIGEMGDWLFLILIAVWFQTATAINEINF